MSSALIWLIAAITIAAVLLRPKEWPEAVWTSLGALLLVASGLLPFSEVLGAIAEGADVYLFLAGMMLLAELARREGVFDWLATIAVRAAKGSRARLFALVYVVGIAVTVFLSNDATAVVLTPAVYAAVKKARSDALPYLLICAFVANAASFVLPISNPANLVVYGKSLPPLLAWLATFLVPSIGAVAATYIALRFVSRRELQGRIEDGSEPAALSREGRRALMGILGAGAVLMGASALGLDLGLPTAVAAMVTVLLATRARTRDISEVARAAPWSVLPLVAGLFVLVEALKRAGAVADVAHVFETCSAMPRWLGDLAASFGIAGLSNVMNNLPSGLLAGRALDAARAAPHIRDAVMIGVDLGPNLSVSGSLATVLWLLALRREGERISAWRFFKAGLLIMPAALLLATLLASVMAT